MQECKRRSRRNRVAGPRPLLPTRRQWRGRIRSGSTSSDLLLEKGVHIAEITSTSIMASSPAPSAPSVSLIPRRSKKSMLLFFCEEMRELAERVAAESDVIELRSINWSARMEAAFVRTSASSVDIIQIS